MQNWFSFFLYFLLGCSYCFSQNNLLPCSIKCKTTLKDSSVRNYHSELCYVQIDEAAQEIRLAIDLSTFKTEHDSVDEWLHKIEKKMLKFKGNFPVESLTSLSNYTPKEIISSGELYINHTHHHFSIKFILVNVEKSIHTNNTNSNSVARIKISFSFELSPDKYKVNFKQHQIVKPICLSVSNGDINKYISGNENILNFHH